MSEENVEQKIEEQTEETGEKKVRLFDEERIFKKAKEHLIKKEAALKKEYESLTP